MRAKKFTYPIFIGAALALGIGIGSFLNFPVKPISLVESQERESKLRQIIDYINYEYVDEVNTDSLLDLTIDDLLKKLDPHSSYISSELAAKSEETMRGSFEGIGVEFKLYRDSLTVIHAIEGGPSEKAGISKGERILKADGIALFGSEVSSEDVISTLKGTSGSKVVLEVYDPQSAKVRSVEVTRDAIAINSVPMDFMLDQETGYIKLLRFAQTSTKEMRSAIKRLKSQGANSLILDLRDNPGGLLVSAREIADEFLENDKLIVFTKERDGTMHNYKSSSRGGWKKGELVVLINGNSASASEIVAGAIQDNDRGWIVGERSFGKGLVQEEITLDDGSRLRLTTQKYYTPSGRSIQKPYESYESYGGHGYLGGEGSFQSSSDLSREEFFTLGGRKVYGGGGIAPDKKVLRDSSNARTFIYHLGLITNFDDRAFAYIDRNRELLEQWDEDRFVEDFEVSDEILDYFFDMHANTINNQSSHTQELVKDRIKAFMAYNLFGSVAFQRIYARHDPYVSTAQQILAEDEL